MRALTAPEVQQVAVLAPATPTIASISAPRQIVNLGQSLALSVTASSATTASYQWKRNGFPIPGATAATYTIAGAVYVRDSGSYQVVVSNSSSSITSSVVLVNVVVNPAQISGVGGNASRQISIPSGLTSVSAVEAWSGHSLALKSDGTVVAWGDTSNGKTLIPSSLSEGVAVSVGSHHSLTLKSDGTVIGWGFNGNGQTTPPVGLTDVVAVDGGSDHSLALKTDGTVVAWGDNSSGQTAIPAGLSGVVAVAAGPRHSLAIKSDGTAVGWGEAASGKLSIPPDTANVVGVAAGSDYSLILRNAASDLPPAIVTQPLTATAVAGLPVSFSVVVTGSPAPTYQWQKNGVNIPGATNASYSIAAPQTSDGGIYTCVVTNSLGSVTSSAAVLTVLESARLANVSIRTTLASAQTLIVGFTVSGGAKDVLVRAAGPALVPLSVATAMVDPRLELYKDSTKLLENDNWPAVLTTTFSGLGAFPFATNSSDAGLLLSVNGSYSAVASGTGPGVVLVEIYDAGSGSASRLVNLSARNQVGTGADILIAGFYLAGTGTKRLLLRAAGPTIGGVPFNVPGTLAGPKLELYNASGAKMTENDTCDSALAAVFASVGAFPFAPNSRDAALVTTLNAGSSYSVWVLGADDGTGEALVEIYEVP